MFQDTDYLYDFTNWLVISSFILTLISFPPFSSDFVHLKSLLWIQWTLDTLLSHSEEL